MVASQFKVSNISNNQARLIAKHSASHSVLAPVSALSADSAWDPQRDFPCRAIMKIENTSLRDVRLGAISCGGARLHNLNQKQVARDSGVPHVE